MSPDVVSDYIVAFAKQYNDLTPGSVGYRGALEANRKVLTELIDVYDGDLDNAELIAELRALMSQSAKLHVAAGGMPIIVPELSGLVSMEGCDSLSGFIDSIIDFLKGLFSRREEREEASEERQEAIEDGTATPEEIEEEEQDQRVKQVQQVRSVVTRRGAAKVQAQRRGLPVRRPSMKRPPRQVAKSRRRPKAASKGGFIGAGISAAQKAAKSTRGGVLRSAVRGMQERHEARVEKRQARRDRIGGRLLKKAQAGFEKRQARRARVEKKGGVIGKIAGALRRAGERAKARREKRRAKRSARVSRRRARRAKRRARRRV